MNNFSPTKHTLILCDLRKFCLLEQIMREHPRELNPYLENNGSGYPKVKDRKKAGVTNICVLLLLRTGVPVGD
ncbi:hypothetical protein RHMOL_Rhmol07G0063200 [Rhododendron molle]|uniref:Uncharacterized protein n=1 Tax=Rhododendron molle TaxID=49168 RepID=A0ACC0MXW5_RHOML|nr:hypothetical protein RHMOL_Rhmol07G0063200 [Rhododendron molle]